MSLKMVARVQMEKREKPHAIKRLAQAASNRHSRCMSPLLGMNATLGNVPFSAAYNAKRTSVSRSLAIGRDLSALHRWAYA
jgi:hypothetical protein